MLLPNSQHTIKLEILDNFDRIRTIVLSRTINPKNHNIWGKTGHSP
jgi:hypothetical protein